MDDEEDDPQLYAWEGIYERSWDKVRVAADGSLVVAGGAKFNGVKDHDIHTNVKRGVLRAVFLVLDASKAAGESDAEMRPSRLHVMVEVACSFVHEFFEQNPISTLAVLVTRDGAAEALTELSCNPRQHVEALKRLSTSVDPTRGEASLQNVLELARESLHAVPAFTSREVLLLSSSLSSCDPGDVLETVGRLRKERVRAWIVSLVAEVFICRKIATDTLGDFHVALDPAHLRALVHRLVRPRPTAAAAAAAPSNSLIRVGFPRRRDHTAGPTLGFAPGSGNRPTLVECPYRCPQCGAAHAELPTQCPICSLKLMSSAELTKTYHHLFPVPAFAEASPPVSPVDAGVADATDAAVKLDAEAAVCAVSTGPPSGFCFACAERLPIALDTRAGVDGARGGGGLRRASGFECPECGHVFCAACDGLIHGTLHACPGCCLGARGRSKRVRAEDEVPG